MPAMPPQPQRRPDPFARLVSHAIVGALAAFVFKKFGGGPALMAAMLSIAAHETLDAPVAQTLTELGF
jgi:hypothetical protein